MLNFAEIRPHGMHNVLFAWVKYPVIPHNTHDLIISETDIVCELRTLVSKSIFRRPVSLGLLRVNWYAYCYVARRTHSRRN